MFGTHCRFLASIKRKSFISLGVKPPCRVAIGRKLLEDIITTCIGVPDITARQLSDQDILLDR